MRYALAAALVFSIATAKAEMRVGGINGVWLVVAKMNDKITGRGLFASDPIVTAASRCGLQVRPVAAFHFDEAKDGLTVVGTGPYASDAVAKAELRQVRRCIPNAHLERLTYYLN